METNLKDGSLHFTYLVFLIPLVWAVYFVNFTQ